MPHYCCSSKALGADFCSSNAANQYAPSKVIEPIHLGSFFSLDTQETNTYFLLL
jgi:hypothetical protein